RSFRSGRGSTPIAACFTYRDVPGPASKQHWLAEASLLAPGLQAIIEWCRLHIVEATGAMVLDADGNCYVDLFGGAGVNSIGHAHSTWVDDLTAAIQRSAIGAFGSDARLEMLNRLRRFLPSGLDAVQLYSGGAEAVEAALRLARSATGANDVLSFWGGYHGRTMGALAATKGHGGGFGTPPPGFISTPYADCRNCPFNAHPTSCSLACVDFARSVLRQESTGGVAAILVEPVQGRSGNVVPPEGYMSALAELAGEFDALLISDESMTGFGRIGYAIGCDRDNVSPDIVILGKGMGGGYPVSAIAARRNIVGGTKFGEPSASSSSFGGFPLACAAASSAIGVIEQEGLVSRSAALGRRFLDVLREGLTGVSCVNDVRGLGMAIGIQIDPSVSLRDVFISLARRGVLVMIGGGAIRLYPPLNIEEPLAWEAAEVMVEVLRSFDDVVTGGANAR
ncbi:MAG: aspartate aminotransferase family protein, partial [Sulfobacillus sp.]